MKFTEFLSEARTVAGDAAAKRGLQHVGHGYYADRSGNIVAKSEKGQRLVAVDKGEAQAAQAGVEQGDQEDAHLTSGEGLGTVAITFGRFNPPTIGHEKLLDAVAKEGVDSYRIYPSRTVDPKKNPLEPEVKVQFMNEMYPSHSEAIVNDSGMSNIFNVMVALQDEGYTGVTLVVGSDRVSEFKSLLEKYNGQAYEFEELNVVSAGERDPDAEGVEGMSASKMRAFAASGDLESFMEGVPGKNKNIAQRLMTEVRKGMGISDEAEPVNEMWEIAPKLDKQGLREAYISEEVFALDTLVEHLDTGVQGKIVYRGANYAIFEDENGWQFRCWLTSLMEKAPKYDKEGNDKFDRFKRMVRHKQDKYGPSTLKQRLKHGGVDHNIDNEKKAKMKEATYPQDFRNPDGSRRAVAKKKTGRPNAQGPESGKKEINEGDFWHPDPDKDRKLGGPGANQRAREDRAASSKPKSDSKKLRPGESYYEYAKRMKTRKEEKEAHKSADDGSGNDWKIGTDTYRKAVQAMTPGQSIKKFSDFRNSK